MVEMEARNVMIKVKGGKEERGERGELGDSGDGRK